MDVLRITCTEKMAEALGCNLKNSIIVTDERNFFALPVNIDQYRPCDTILDVYTVTENGRPAKGLYYTGARWNGYRKTYDGEPGTPAWRLRYRLEWAKSVNVKLTFSPVENVMISVEDHERSDGFLTILIEATCPLTGTKYKHRVAMSDSELGDILEGIGLIQNIVPDLTPDEREAIITGIYPGALNEKTFWFTCFKCGAHYLESIEKIGQPFTCDSCGQALVPFEKE